MRTTRHYTVYHRPPSTTAWLSVYTTTSLSDAKKYIINHYNPADSRYQPSEDFTSILDLLDGFYTLYIVKE